MLPTSLFSALAHTKRLLMCATLSVAIVACGGGGGSPGSVPGAPVTPTNPVAADPTMTMTIVNEAEVAVSSISGSQTAFVKVKLIDSNGVGAPDSLVTFSNSNGSLVQFIPANGSAKTDASGNAVIAIKPVSVSSVGALSITATGTSSVSNKSATATKVISVVQGPVTVPVSSEPQMTLSIADGQGAPVTTLAGSQIAFVTARLVDASGVGAADSLVRFTASDPSLVKFTPDNGSAKTDSTGTAVIAIQPTSVTASGALSISVTGTSTLTSKSATAAKVISVSPAPLVVGALSFATPAPAKLAAFSTIVINIPVTSGGQPATSITGLSLTSQCVADGTAKLIAGSLNAGIQTATYTNTGCLRGTDTITAVIGTSSQAISLGVDAANIGTIQFVSSDLNGSSIVLRGSGGLGRKESALLTFRVLDQNNTGLAGVDVSFKATTTAGGLAVLPAAGTTDAQGFVTTTVSSGSIPTPVRVVAEASRNGKVISGLSDTLTISTGLPIQRSMSLSSDAINIEALSYDGTVANITVRLADQYGNPISDDTAVSFITEGGAVGTSARGACTTANGGCSVQLRSQNFRPLNGRVTVLAYVQGVEDFVDLNGDGQYSCTDPIDATGARPVVYRPLVDTCRSGGEPFTDLADAFLDAGVLTRISGFPTTGGSLDGTLDAANGDLPIPFNPTGYQAVGNGKWGLNFIRASQEFVFSGSEAYLVRQKCDENGNNCSGDWGAGDGNPGELAGMHNEGGSTACKLGKTFTLVFRLHDVNNNPLAADSSIGTADANKLAPGTVFPNTVLSTSRVGGTFHRILVKAEDSCASGSFSVRVSSPKGLTMGFNFKSVP